MTPYRDHDCEFKGDEEKHPAIFEIIFYSIATGSECDVREKVHKIRYSCVKHLLDSVDDFRENEEVGDTIANLRNGNEYWRVKDALREVDQFPARIEVYDPNPISRLLSIQQMMKDYVGSPGEIKKGGDKNVLVVKGGLESIMALATKELKNMEDISFSMHIDRKDLRYK